mgnify:CR=1 FL=1
MRIGGYADYSSTQDYSKIKYQDDEGIVTRKSSRINPDNSSIEDTSENSNENNKPNLPANKIMDIAVNKDLKANKDLIGSNSSLESLDVKKAISDMQKDKILMEYQTFVKNPESEDGIVRKIN